ncbi:MAG TPA: glycine cleavage system protein GcvH [Planctomycetaceae bacterium]|jgi:glycine cleavage system H protein|nr:glycine cleavage system protein H [Planctomycetaceae bacterium]HCK52859.1 glycine cleavage system protein GcvH [Planctomycetaceae bacterium]|tara:strand:+ start:271 stop:657 length:387 start_codon:yes stop_codon:yes gene_type:complete
MDPATLKYSQSHEWLHLDGNTATIGITDFAVKALTDLVYVELPELGRTLNAGEIFGEVESVKAVSDLYAPIAGEVIEINSELPDDLDALSEDPFGRGWMIKLTVTDDSAADALLDEPGYQAHCQSAGH